MGRAYAPQLTAFLSTLIDTSVQFGLLTFPPNGQYLGGVVEPGAGYSMQTISLVQTGIMCASNPAAITWTATGAWPAAEYFGIYDMGGTLLYWGQLQVAVASNSGGTVSIPPGAVYVDWNNNCPNYNPEFGTPMTVNLPVATVGNSVPLIAVLTDDSYPTDFDTMTLISGITANPFNHKLIHIRSMLSGSVNGNMKRQRMADCTRGTSNLFTVTVPNGLAF
jgi:hypothetical protein